MIGSTGAISSFFHTGSYTVANNVAKGQSLNDSNWHFVAITIPSASTGVKIYIDGNCYYNGGADGYDFSSGTGAITTLEENSMPVLIGAVYDTPSVIQNFFTGLIDELKVYNTELSASEVSAEYNLNYGKNRYVPLSPQVSYSGSKTVILSWSAPQYSSLIIVNNYKIYRKKNSGSYELIKTVDGNTRAYTDETITQPGTYTYSVTSYVDSTNIESSASDTITTKEITIIPSDPQPISPDRGGDVSSPDDSLTKVIIPEKTLKNTYYWEIKKANSVDINSSDKVVGVYEVKASEKSDMTNPKTILEGSISISIHTTIAELQGMDSTITASNVRDKAKVAYWNKVRWLPLTSEVVLDSNNIDVQVTSRTSHLSQYGITTVSKSGSVVINVSPNPFTPAASQYNIANFTFENTDNENVEIKIWDITGVQVKTIVGYGSSISWDGKNDNGDNVEGGVYIYQIKVGNSRAGKGTVVVAY